MYSTFYKKVGVKFITMMIIYDYKPFYRIVSAP